MLDERLFKDVSVSVALAQIFRGNLCETLLQNRHATTFDKNTVIYEVGDGERTFFFIRRGYVKVGTIAADGREITYFIRKDGDVVGELCAYESPRRDRAVTLEPTAVVPVSFAEIIEFLAKRPDLLKNLVGIFCKSLADAYEQVDTIALADALHRVIRVLLKLAAELGRPVEKRVEISSYLTQEEIAQMVAARRERVSTALNQLRRSGMVEYSRHGHLVVDVKALESQL
jgi:CRP/FNR family transcriptional regulator, cyclic AMP receptor protein